MEGPNFLLDLIEGTKDELWVYVKGRQGSKNNYWPWGVYFGTWVCNEEGKSFMLCNAPRQEVLGLSLNEH